MLRIWIRFSVLFLLHSLPAFATDVISITQLPQGQVQTGATHIWHDAQGTSTLADARVALERGEFVALETAGSTGLQPGAFWSYFILHNTLSEPITLHLEYVDHQLIELQGFAQESNGEFRSFGRVTMEGVFDQRLVNHNRLVLPLQLNGGEQQAVLVKFSSSGRGFVFPSMRIWTPATLAKQATQETSLMAFLVGGFFLMALFAFVSGLVAGERIFYAYSLYCASKIAVWMTIFGYTHQYLLTDHFQWNYMSISGAVTIFCGLLFARMFLQSARHMPRLDWLLLAMMSNAAILFVAAIFEQKAIAHISITLALLLYPVVVVASLVRWRQGSRAAGIFAIAWGILVCSLVIQALRDLGVVEHNLVNYFGPPVASFVEMLTIMFAMGLRVRGLRKEKERVEQTYRAHLERSKNELERQVLQRTQELQLAKQAAEKEASTDYLTGIFNRRRFIQEAQSRIKLCQRKSQPVSLLMFDLDHFKQINDEFGHSVGDTALKAFAQGISQHVRETDVFGRLGGEEFGLLICESAPEALQTAERLKQVVSKLQISLENATLSMTTSIGIADGQPNSTIESLMHDADQALYRAKSAGRNQVLVAP